MESLLIYLIFYPSVRFCLEFLRTDSWFFPGTPFNVVHLLSAVAIVTAITLLIVRHRKPAAVAAQAAEGTTSVGSNEARSVEGNAKSVEEDFGEVEHKAEKAQPVDQTLETADGIDTIPSANGTLEDEDDKDMETVATQSNGMKADS